MAIPPIGMCSAVCGGGLCGADIPVPSTPVAPIDNPEFYVPLSRATALNADGSIQTLHPVDQEVIFNLSNKLGSIPNDSTRGLDVDAIRRAPDNRKLQTAEDRVALALSALVANGDVAILDVSLEDPAPAGTLGLTVNYRNLRLPTGTPPKTVTR